MTRYVQGYPCGLSVHITDFINGRRENHEVFSFVDEMPPSPLTLTGRADRFLACVANRATNLSITPECPFLPKMSSQIL